MITSIILFVAMALNDSVPQTEYYHAIVTDIETNVPIRDAKVVVDGGVEETTTKWDGTFSVSVPFKQLTFSKKGYLIRKLNYEERTDTIFLLNNLRNIDEVVVWGKRPTISMDMKHIFSRENIGGTTPSGIDFLESFEHIIHAKKYKRRKKFKKYLEEY